MKINLNNIITFRESNHSFDKIIMNRLNINWNVVQRKYIGAIERRDSMK